MKMPDDNPQILVVHSLSEYFNARFGPASLIVLPRELKGDFNAIAARIVAETPVRQYHTPMEEDAYTLGWRIRDWKAAGNVPAAEIEAAETMLADLQAMQDVGVSAGLWLIDEESYKSDANVHELHADPVGAIDIVNYTDPTTTFARWEDVLATSRADTYALKAGAELRHFARGSMHRMAGSLNRDGVPPLVHAGSDGTTKAPRALLRAVRNP